MQARTRQQYPVVVVAVALLLVLGGAALGQDDANLGTWKLNLARSNYDPGPAPMSDTRVYER